MIIGIFAILAPSFISWTITAPLFSLSQLLDLSASLQIQIPLPHERQLLLSHAFFCNQALLPQLNQPLQLGMLSLEIRMEAAAIGVFGVALWGLEGHLVELFAYLFDQLPELGFVEVLLLTRYLLRIRHLWLLISGRSRLLLQVLHMLRWLVLLLMRANCLLNSWILLCHCSLFLLLQYIVLVIIRSIRRYRMQSTASFLPVEQLVIHIIHFKL